MAYDEVLEHRSRLSMQAAFPTLQRLKLDLDTNPLGIAEYGPNVRRGMDTKAPMESLWSPLRQTYCANPLCHGSTIDLHALCNKVFRPEGGAIAFTFDTPCSGHEYWRLMTVRERCRAALARKSWAEAIAREHNGWFIVDRTLSGAPCGNTLRMAGHIEFAPAQG